jgi:HK97 family phage portal protein
MGYVMTFFDRLRNVFSPRNSASSDWRMQFLQGGDTSVPTSSVTLSSSQKIHTAYRCVNILSDDIADMPMQVFERVGQRLAPIYQPRNITWLMEFEPNRWMNPFIFKKTVVKWLINWGEAYIWGPPGRGRDQNELIILPSDRTIPMYDRAGNLWYQVTWLDWEPMYLSDQNPQYYPDVEVLKLLINSDDGVTGNSVLSRARETLARQLSNFNTQNQIAGKGLNPSGIAWMRGELDKDARKKVRESYEEAMKESGIAVFDAKVTKFDTVTMKPVDAQFLEIINATDVQIANFYGVPLFKLNQGKQSYESNAQQDLDYLKTTLNPYLVQWENEARRKWLSLDQQVRGFYFKFNRDVILATDAKTRAEYLQMKINSGQLTPNEARQIDDMPAFPGGDSHYIPANTGQILPDGSIKSGAAIPAAGASQ